MAIDLCCCSCGGSLDLSNAKDKTIKCEYCGKEQIIPSLDNEARLKSYKRATDFRFKKQFDDAQRIYESMLLQFPDDYEVRWGLCLCKYGVEYIDDFDGKKIPICHRNLFESILNNEDYIFAVEHCDSVSQEIIRKDAKYIDEVQKKYIKISKTEKPYDIFISYKETETESKNRTKDSLLAEEIYEALVKEGFKVFFSRITLEDKLGQDYEPNIEFALSTSKIMLLVGTTADNIRSTWVKSEWSRYLRFMQKERGKKTLIPCYLGFDPYELPDEISSFQAQDLSKIGAIKDIIRGVKKIINPAEVSSGSLSQVIATLNKNTSGGDTAIKLLRRAEIHVERGEISEAKSALNNCLNNDPENAQAYTLLALIDYGVKTISDLDGYEPEMPKFEEIFLNKVSNKKLNFYLPESQNPEDVVVYNPYTPPDVSKTKFSSDEIDLIFDKRGFVGLLTMDETEAKKLFSFKTIDENKDFKTALKFADSGYRNELDNHLSEHLNSRNEFISRCLSEYNNFVKARFDELKSFYLEYSYKTTCALNKDKREICSSFLILGKYEDSHKKAFDYAKQYIQSTYTNIDIAEFLKKNFEGEELDSLLSLLKQSIEEDKNKTIEKLNELRAASSSNRGVRFDFIDEEHRKNQLEETEQHVREIISVCEASEDESIKAYKQELSYALSNTKKSLSEEQTYHRNILKRKEGIHKSTIIVDIVFIFIALLMSIFAFMTKYAIDHSLPSPFMCYILTGGFAILIVPGAIVFCFVFLNPFEDGGFLGIVFGLVISIAVGCVLAGLLGCLAFAAPYVAYPLLITEQLRLLTLIILVGIPCLITMIIELARHKFKPASGSYIFLQILMIVLAIVFIVGLYIFLHYLCDIESLPKDFAKLYFESAI